MIYLINLNSTKSLKIILKSENIKECVKKTLQDTDISCFLNFSY